MGNAKQDINFISKYQRFGDVFTSNDYGAAFPPNVEVLEGMSREAGFIFTKNIIQYQGEFIPQYRDSRGDFEGISYRLGPAAPSPDPAARLLYKLLRRR